MLINLSELDNGHEFDVLIVGAGMVGASTAIGLTQIGLKVLLIDSFAFKDAVPVYTPSYDARSTALSWGTRDILTDLSVWSEVEKNACPIAEVHVSEKGRFGTSRIKAQDYHQQALGYVVPNQWLGRSLLSKVNDLNIPLCASVEVDRIVLGASHQIDLLELNTATKNSKTILTKLVVIADGTDSKTARKVGIESTVQHYSQHAIIANVTTELANQGVAYERFTSKGPLAMLPLSDYECAIVWTHDQKDVNRYLELTEEAFCHEIEACFGERLGRVTKCGARSSYSLKLIQAKEKCRPGILLLGNAAHSLHPVAGQGFNLAIRGVAASVQNIADCLKNQQAYEGLKNLSRLCESLQSDQLKTISMSDQLVKIFGSQSLLTSISREIGLIGLDNTPFLKSLFAAQAMGLAGRKNKLPVNL